MNPRNLQNRAGDMRGDQHYRGGGTGDPRDRRDVRGGVGVGGGVVGGGVVGGDLRDRYDDRHYAGGGGGVGRGAPVGGNRSDQARIFVALFNYDPPTMSPNPDACEEELGFRESQLIRVIGDKDADGFYWGEAGGRCGYVPCNIVSEVQVRILYFTSLPIRNPCILSN